MVHAQSLDWSGAAQWVHADQAKLQHLLELRLLRAPPQLHLVQLYEHVLLPPREPLSLARDCTQRGRARAIALTLGAAVVKVAQQG